MVSADEIKICEQAGVIDLAERFVAEGKTLPWVTDRLKHADQIRGQCVAASHLNPVIANRAADFIRANAKPDEVSHTLLKLFATLEGPEIDPHQNPQMLLGAKPQAHASNGNGNKRPATASQIYVMRNRQGTGDQLDRIAKAIAEALK